MKLLSLPEVHAAMLAWVLERKANDGYSANVKRRPKTSPCEVTRSPLRAFYCTKVENYCVDYWKGPEGYLRFVRWAYDHGYRSCMEVGKKLDASLYSPETAFICRRS